MPIEFHCSRCGRLLRTGDDTAGRMAQCPECGGQTQVPAQETSARPSPAPLSGAGGSFDAGSQQRADSAGYQIPYQTPTGHGPGPGAEGNYLYASQRVSAPAVCLIVTAVLGLGLHLLGFIWHLSMAGPAMHRNVDALPEMLFTGPIAIIQSSIGIILSILVLIGAMKMKVLENYGLAMAASIVALIPCIGPCCLLGLPFGIWALVVLSDPVVKSSFKT
jgi:DNA-directed RNA polymerase subunit RPC12/RpoP